MLKYAPELDKRIRPHLKPTNDSWRVDETYIKIKGVWKYLYRAIDSDGNTLDFMLSAKRDGKAAARLFHEILKGQHARTPRVINVDKNAAYPVAMEIETAELRQAKYLNNVIEQDNRNIKRIARAMMAFKSFNSTRRTLGIEAMNMIRKEQVKGIEQGDSVSQARFIEGIFEIAV